MTEFAKIYGSDAIADNASKADVISVEEAQTIPGLLQQRSSRSGQAVAYTEYDSTRNEWVSYTWLQVSEAVKLWCGAITEEALAQGERAAIRMQNGLNWILSDQSLMASGLVVVPVYAEDRPDNIAYILNQTECRLLFIDRLSQWQEMEKEAEIPDCLQRVIVVHNDEETNVMDAAERDSRLITLERWLEKGAHHSISTQPVSASGDDLATIVFTSGTTGKPKGVMLSHNNMLKTAYGGLQNVVTYPSDRFLSFLPLSHMFERTVGYYLTMMAGSSVTFNRSIPELLDDLAEIRPTAMITVPRIFERAYSKIKTQIDEGSGLKRYLFNKAVEIGWQRFLISQGRASWNFSQVFWPILDLLVASKIKGRFGGNLRFVISGGAPLSPKIAKLFIGLGIEILQGYGLTEASPVLTVNTLEKNKPETIGLPLRSAELRVVDTGELQARGPSVMLGYWRNDAASAETMEGEWLQTGDIARIDNEGFISITGRIKEIIVMANGEKVPPADMEAAISDDSLFEQAMIIGEGRSYLTALVVLNPEVWPEKAASLGFDLSDQALLTSEKLQDFVLQRISRQMEDFPGYAVVRKVCVLDQVWSVDNGALTPTLKIKRPVLRERYQNEITAMYQGH